MKLRADNLTLTAGERVLCRDLSFEIAPGELWGVLGCNGSGKTTLLHGLAGLAPYSGAILLGDRPLPDYSRRELGCRLGILLQREDQDFWGSVRDYVMLGRYPHAQSWLGWGADDEAAGERALAAFDLAALADRAYASLSGGERQRARLAQLWAQSPPLMLLDEPLQHLDLRHQLQTLEHLRAATRQGGAGAAVVLHDLTFARRCDRILLLYGDGRHASGEAAELLQPALLAELYGCRIDACGDGENAHFIPVI
ncbi:MAG: putative siderophore transport system ATP-binding protein YusV [Betaproteobacteria bacterium]|nr:putative siderophore transport system ATP-binding protein YusV [Betaproteobacteria bacterium]